MNMMFTEVTSFIGRKAEISNLSGLLAAERLVTVTGSGGVGKTRVALRSAERATGQFPDGVHVAELSGLADPELLPNTVAASLGMMRQEAREQRDAVLAYLRSRRLLLILDTCERLIDACALFAEEVIATAPGVTILATSRQPLDAAGERVFSLSPLPVPETGSAPGASDAAELFTRRAAADQEFSVTEGNWPDVVRICRRLAGIPLAIELAAVRMRALPVRALADQLEECFDTLATRHGGPERHRTLNSAIEWSYDLCAETERALWARLSVFAGSFSIAAAREVCGGGQLPADGVVSALVGLVDKSVVARAGDRYRMLDTIREFGAAKLAESGQDSLYKGKHVSRYLEAARDFGEHFLDNDQPGRLRDLRAEHDNLRAALGHSLGNSDASDPLTRAGAELASALYGYWMASGLLREGRHWLGLALDRLPAGPSPERAWALITRAFLGPNAGEPEPAVAEAAEGIRIARELGDNGLLLARGHLFHQFALMFTGRTDEAHAAGTEARQGLEPLKDRIGLIILEAQTAHLHNLSANFPAAVESCTLGLDMLREGSRDSRIGEQWMQGFLYLNAGLALYFQGAQDEAKRCFSQALSIQAGQDDTLGCGYALEGLGWVAVGQQEWSRAALLLGGADARWKEIGARLGNNALLEEFHRQMTDAVRQGLGEQRYDEQVAAGGRQALSWIVQQTSADAGPLPLPSGGA